MSAFVTQISKASTWLEYYNAYKSAYRHLFEDSWALGTAEFANQLHHTAIPDVSGMTASLNWAVYSQPSHESLKAFLPVFRDLLQSEPHRIRSSRYLFFVAEGFPLSRETVMTTLGELGNIVDFWCGSLEKALSLPEHYAIPLGLDALLGGGKWLDDFLSVGYTYSEDRPLDFLQSIRESALKHLPIESSIAPQLIRKPLVDSFFILMAFQLQINPQQIVHIIGEHSGLSAYIASDRAITAHWKHETVGYCSAILELCPPKAIEYVVEPGDILSRIVRKHFEMPFERLWPLIRVLNPEISNPNRILAGQRIRLPDLSDKKSER